MTTVRILELTGARREWISTHRTANGIEAAERAIHKHFGGTHGFKQDNGLPPAYGSIIRTLSPRERGNGSTWAAEVVIGKVRIDVDYGTPERRSSPYTSTRHADEMPEADFYGEG